MSALDILDRKSVVCVLGVRGDRLRLQSVGNEKRTAEQGKIRQNKNRVRPPGRTLPKATDDSDMYNREFPSGNFLFFVVCMMSLFRLP